MRKENTMSLLNNSITNLAALRAAVAEARTFANEHSDEYDWNGLFANRQVFGGAEFVWHVSFDLSYFMTHFFFPDMRGRSDDEIADEIWSCWDADRHDVQVVNLHVGSSDFKQRDSEYWGSSGPTE